MTEAQSALYKAMCDVGLTTPRLKSEQVLAALAKAGYVVVKANEKKLHPANVRDIRASHKRGMSQAEIAWSYQINPATVSRIVRGHYH